MTKNSIIDLFKFSEKEKNIFEYIFDYSAKIEKYLGMNSFDEKQLERYILIGLFLEYRACNHRGESLITDVNKKYLSEDKKKQFNTINNLLGKKIETTQEYLRLIKLVDIHNVNGESLYNFVISGEWN